MGRGSFGRGGLGFDFMFLFILMGGLVVNFILDFFFLLMFGSELERFFLL